MARIASETLDLRGLTVKVDALELNGTAMSATDFATAATLITDLTATATELNKNAGVTAGTATASKTAVLGANKNLDTLVLAASGLKIGSGAGTAVTATAAELNTVAGVTAGTVAASKAIVADANGATLTLKTAALSLGTSGSETAVTASAAEINRACTVSARLVAAGSTLAVTQALHDGKLILLDTAAGSVCTLPAASGSGMRLRFAVSVTATSNSHVVKVANVNDTIAGFVHVNDMDGTAVAFYKANGATSSDDTITMNRTTTGGVIGDVIDVVDFKANLWLIQYGALTCVAGSNIATPFSATV